MPFCNALRSRRADDPGEDEDVPAGGDDVTGNGSHRLKSVVISDAELFAVSTPACIAKRGPEQKINPCQGENDTWRPKPGNRQRDHNRSQHAKTNDDQASFALLNHLTAAGKAEEFFLSDGFSHSVTCYYVLT